MGCATSKHDDLPAVALCRERCTFLDEAIHHRYALAEAHVAYLYSLKSVGSSLHRFFQLNEHDLDHLSTSSSGSPLSPVLNLPTHRKGGGGGKDIPEASSPPVKKAAIHHKHHDSHSSSGSHLHFHDDSGSDDDDDDSGSEALHHHHTEKPPARGNQYGQFSYADHDETLGFGAPYPAEPGAGYGAPYQVGPPYQAGAGGGFGAPYQAGPGGGYGAPYQAGGGYGAPYQGSGGYMHMNYMRKQPTPSVTYQQRPMSPETVRMGEASSSYYSYPNNTNSNYPDYSDYGGGGFFSSSMMQRPYAGVSSPPAAPSGAGPSTSKPPPPPPSPPRNSPWDFLNPFQTFETNYPPYTPSRDSREVREEEGIPDLEDEEDFQHEVVKEVHGHQKFVDNLSKAAAVAEEGSSSSSSSEKQTDYHGGRPSGAMENEHEVEYEVHVVEKKVVVNEEGNKSAGGDGGNVKARAFTGDSDVVKEIQVQFERASESGNDLAKMLEVGKVPHNRKHATYQVSSKMLHAITPSLSVVSSQPSTSKSAEIQIADPAASDVEGEVIARHRNLSSTLNKLYLWEKKLYQEVKSEEKIRVLHERKSQKLKRLDEKGAEAHKVEITRQLVRSLSTKIRIAIQVVDKISEKINKMRDEELWPQLNEFIHGLSTMWRGMLECHRNQCQAIGEAKRLDAIASHRHFSDTHLEATLQLEHELLNWTLRFSCWVNAQKGYVRALNTWLMKCLLYVPEETPDGRVPFSPGRIGAPPIFVICNQWSQTIEGVSEKEVIDCMRDFATNVLQLWERDKLEMRQRMMVNKNMERKVKNLDREDQKIQKEIHALGKRIVLVGEDNGLSLNRHAVYQSDTSKNGSLQVGLRHIFEAMERFTAKSLKIYEELLQRIEEDDLA